MKEIAFNYYNLIKSTIDNIVVTDADKYEMPLYDGVEKAAQHILEFTRNGKKLIFIGNGASQAISSHMSTDFWKNGGMRAVPFTDPSLLTCLGNDYGYEFVFEKAVNMFADTDDILIGISSSGGSLNILNAVKTARDKQCSVITLSGFKPNNPLRQTGDINFYVPYNDYGPVEILHHSILHCILDTINQYNAKTQ
jgi:D-sedoheptulose 7-phosphate isomerase